MNSQDPGSPLVVLWEDPHGLAVSKPAGMLTQGPEGGEATLEAQVRRYLRPDDPSKVYLGTVHRLDRPVSGVILWAKTPKAARRWAEQFARREARKEYWAIVATPNVMIEPAGLWDDWLGAPDARGRASVVEAETPRAVRALTRFEVGRDRPVPEGFAWLRLSPETGRTHQLRVQSSARGFPIVGDATYDSAQAFPQGIALHARRLAIEHPITRQALTIETPLPATWSGWLGGSEPA